MLNLAVIVCIAGATVCAAHLPTQSVAATRPAATATDSIASVAEAPRAPASS